MNPGSPEAVAAGCLCPIIDNHHGHGIEHAEGEILFWKANACPLHGSGKSPDEQGVVS